MICPHCNRSIAEEQRSLMSRPPADDLQELPPHMRRLGQVGLAVIGFVVLVGLLAMFRMHGGTL